MDKIELDDLSFEDSVKVLIDSGMTEVDAVFYASISHGLISGDKVPVDDDGNEIPKE